MNTPVFDEAAIELLKEAGLTPQEVDRRLECARDPDYWSRLNPQLSVLGESKIFLDAPPLDAGRHRTTLERLETEGYFQLPPLFEKSSIDSIRQAVETVRAAGWPMVFAFVYRECWQIFRANPIVQMLSSALGDGYLQNSRIWCFYVHPRRGASGWPPHADKFKLNNRVSIWLPITDATLDNGCMYVIPRNRVPESLRELNFPDFGPVNYEQLSALLRGTRAVPAMAGSLLGWNFQLIHWGSMNQGADQPRIALGAEFISKDVSLGTGEAPVFPVRGALPTFADRMKSIGTATLTFGKREPLPARFQRVAEELAGPG